MDNFSSLGGYDLFCNIEIEIKIEIKIAFQFMQYLASDYRNFRRTCMTMHDIRH